MQITPGGNGIGEIGGSEPNPGFDKKSEFSSDLANVETGFKVSLVFLDGCGAPLTFGKVVPVLSCRVWVESSSTTES